MQAQVVTQQIVLGHPPLARVDIPAFAVLRRHYAELEALLERLAVTPFSDGAIRESLFSRFAEKLLLQLDLEETVFYPALAVIAPREIRRGNDELDLIRRRLEALLGLAATDDSFPAHAAILGELVLTHADRDERRLFPICEAELSIRRLEDLGTDMRYYLTGDCGMLPLDEASSSETHLFI